jgi:uroporphyrinogen-III synthase
MGIIYHLSDEPHEGSVALGLIQIHFLDYHIDFDTVDSVIFTSKNAVLALASHADKLSTKTLYSIGKKTTKAIKALGLEVAYEASDSHGDAFAQELVGKIKGKLLYPKATKVLSHLIETLHPMSVDVYETVCAKSDVVLEKDSMIIFSSPSSIECFLANYSWSEGYKAVSIGKTTTKHLPSYIIAQQASEQSLESCIALAQSLMAD